MLIVFMYKLLRYFSVNMMIRIVLFAAGIVYQYSAESSSYTTLTWEFFFLNGVRIHRCRGN